MTGNKPRGTLRIYQGPAELNRQDRRPPTWARQLGITEVSAPIGTRYCDFATLNSCVTAHNHHLKSAIGCFQPTDPLPAACSLILVHIAASAGRHLLGLQKNNIAEESLCAIVACQDARLGYIYVRCACVCWCWCLSRENVCVLRSGGLCWFSVERKCRTASVFWRRAQPSDHRTAQHHGPRYRLVRENTLTAARTSTHPKRRTFF